MSCGRQSIEDETFEPSKYPTSYAIANLVTDTPSRTATEGDHLSAAVQFKLDLYNIGGDRNPNPYRPRFEGGFGEYQFFADRDREIAEQHGFNSVKEIFEYLNAFLERCPQQNRLKFTTPWHEIDLSFSPRKRKQSENEARRAHERQSMASASASSPVPSGTPAFAQLALTSTSQRPPSPEETPPPEAICLEDVIHAVIRHPLLLPNDPVTALDIIIHAPHLLNGPSVLWVLSHNGLRNEVVSQILRKRGIEVPSNVLAHRKKAALEHMGGTYKGRKAQYEEFRKSLDSGISDDSWRQYV